MVWLNFDVFSDWEMPKMRVYLGDTLSPPQMLTAKPNFRWTQQEKSPASLHPVYTNQ